MSTSSGTPDPNAAQASTQGENVLPDLTKLANAQERRIAVSAWKKGLRAAEVRRGRP
jgi:hypothetical protein